MTFHSFSNISSMTAAPKVSLSDGDSAIVTAVGTGGTFAWHATSVTQQNLGTVFEADEGGSGRWLRLNPYPLNVQWFGAVGDGVTDDTDAFRRVLATGGHVLVPFGEYLITEPLGEMPDSMWLQGSGPHKANGYETQLHYTGSGSMLVTNSRNKISDLWLQGPATSTYVGNAGTGIEIQGGHHVLDRVRIAGFENGIKIGGAYWCEYRSMIIEENLTGIALDCVPEQNSTTQTFIGVAIYENKFSGVSGVNVPTRNVCYTFLGGSIENNGLETGAPQFKPLALEQLSMTGVYFENSSNPGHVTLDLGLCGDVAITSCFFNGASQHITSSSNGSSHVLFTANRFLGTTDNYAVYMPSCLDVTHRANESDKPYYLTGAASGELAI
jgi:hypothetical protein